MRIVGCDQRNRKGRGSYSAARCSAINLLTTEAMIAEGKCRHFRGHRRNEIDEVRYLISG